MLSPVHTTAYALVLAQPHTVHVNGRADSRPFPVIVAPGTSSTTPYCCMSCAAVFTASTPNLYPCPTPFTSVLITRDPAVPISHGASSSPFSVQSPMRKPRSLSSRRVRTSADFVLYPQP